MKIKVIISVLFLMLSVCLCASAEETGYLVKFKDGYLPDVAEYNLTEVDAQKGIYSLDYADFERLPEEYIEYSAPNEMVSLIEGEVPVVTFSLPHDELNSQQWQLQMVNAQSGWKLETYGNGVKIAVIDSGCYEHEDLKDNLLDGYNYRDKKTDTTDENGHGTHVSGIIAAQMNDIGICGVAPKAKIVPLKCFGASREGNLADILKAIYDAVDIYDCRIINMSWGATSDNEFLKEAIDYAYNKGAILIAAVGNESSEVLCYPAAYENVIGVTSVGVNKAKSSFAQYNKSVAVAAPGERVLSTFKNGDYMFADGTSQATPYVSGIAAVALAANKWLTNAEFAQLLTETAEDLGDEGYDTYFGYGLVDEDALLNRIMQDIRYYVSPVNETETDAYVLIKNNTERIFGATSLFAQYSDGKFLDCKSSEVILMPDKEIIISTEKTADMTVSHFLWSISANMTPIAEERKSER